MISALLSKFTLAGWQAEQEQQQDDEEDVGSGTASGTGTNGTHNA